MASIGYTSAKSIDCVTNGKRFDNWTRTCACRQVLKKMSEIQGIEEFGAYNSGALVEYERGGNKGVWLHPCLIDEYQRYVNSVYEKSDFLYVINQNNTSFMKIGIASDVGARLRTLQSGNPFQLSIVLKVKHFNAARLESNLHEMFKHQKMKGEWFDIPFDNIKAAINSLIERG